MKVELLDLFEATFGAPAEVFSQAPGRLEILGNHTDYNEGFVLSTAVDCYTSIALRKVDGETCRVYSPNVEETVRSFSLSEIGDVAKSKDWTNYIQGTVREFQKRGFEVPAFEAAIMSTVPLSAGMSSSASLEVGIIKGLSEFIGKNISLKEMARIGQGCENNYIGANTGLMDQFSSLAGEKDCFVLSEYRDLSVKTVPVPEHLSLVVFNSGVKHDLSCEYNERREQCEEALEDLKKVHPEIIALRDVSMEQLNAEKENLSEEAYKRALHVVGENERVHKAIERFEKEDLNGFAKLLFESHQSSIENFENSCDELDFLVGLAQKSDLCYGARLSGGGFGGISIHLVERDRASDYRAKVQKAFEQEYSRVPESFICHSARGAFAEKLMELVE